MDKIRLLTISPTCEIGGGDINLFRLLSRLDKDKYALTHIFPYAGGMLDSFKDSGIDVLVLDMPRLRFFKNPLSYLIFAFRFFPTVFRIKKVIVERKIDIACTSTMANVYGCLAAFLSGRPHILIALEYLPVFRVLAPYFYFFSKRIICCSELVRGIFSKKAKTEVLPLCVDLMEFNPGISGKRIRNDLGFYGPLVSMVTRIDRWKGVEVFIRAAKFVPGEVKFAIFGQALMGKEPYILALRRLIEKEGLSGRVIIKAGEYGVKDTPEIIAASDIIVHASLRPEPFGIIIVEAMASGKPVIASGSGGPLEIINDHQDGILISPVNPAALGKEVSGILEDHDLAARLGACARKKAEGCFSLDGYVKRFEDIIAKDAKDI